MNTLSFLLIFIQLLQLLPWCTGAASDTNASNEQLKSRQEAIKAMTLDAWNIYQKHAWRSYAVVPFDRQPEKTFSNSGGTITAALPIFHLMNLTEQFNTCREFVQNQFNFKELDAYMNVYLTVTVQIGGLLSTYALTGDELFLKKAIEVGEAIEGAFNTSTGLPTYSWNPKRQTRYNNPNANTSYLGTVNFEEPTLLLLADLAGNKNSTSSALAYRTRLAKIHSFISSLEKPAGGLYPHQINVETGSWEENLVSLAASSHEFFYNLIRSYSLSGKQKTTNLKLYEQALQKYVQKKMFQKAGYFAGDESNVAHFTETESNSSLNESPSLFTPEFNYESDSYTRNMGGSSCSLPAMFALASDQLKGNNTATAAKSGSAVSSNLNWQLAHGILKTCEQAVAKTKTKLLPKQISFVPYIESNVIVRNGSFRIGFSNPESSTNQELAETYFILWRLTQKAIWREKSWELAQAIKAHQKTANGGFAPIKNVNQVPTEIEKRMQYPQFFSSTFKYLYLTQLEDENVLPLDKWVFNAAGHPFPICGQHSIYPKAACLS